MFQIEKNTLWTLCICYAPFSSLRRRGFSQLQEPIASLEIIKLFPKNSNLLTVPDNNQSSFRRSWNNQSIIFGSTGRHSWKENAAASCVFVTLIKDAYFLLKQTSSFCANAIEICMFFTLAVAAVAVTIWHVYILLWYSAKSRKTTGK